MSQGVEWAVHACAMLAPLPVGSGLSLAALADLHGVPQAYMAKQMQLLSKARIVRTSRGQSGGYALARPAAEVSLWDITRALNGTQPLFRCSEIRQKGPCAVPRADCRRPCQIAAAFASAEAAWRDALAAVTIADISASVAAETSAKHLSELVGWLGANMTTLPRG